MTLFNPETHPHHQHTCARCTARAVMWSGVEEWQNEQGEWIGFCSNECKAAWLNRGIHRINDDLVTYICTCGAKTDSSGDLNGWAFAKHRVFCPSCDRAHLKAKAATSSETSS